MKKHVIFLVVGLLAFVNMPAQNLYRSALKEYVEYSNPLYERSVGDFSSSLEKMTKQFPLDLDESQVSALAEKYRNEQLLDVFIDSMLVPAFQRSVSLEDLRTQTDLLKSPEGKQYTAHYSQMGMKAKGESGAVKELLVNILEYGIKGTPLKDLKANKKIPKEYLKKYNQVMDTSFMSSAVNALVELKGLQNSREMAGDMGGRYMTMINYVKRNAPTLCLNMFYESMTMDDLEFMMKQRKDGSQQRIEAAQKEMVDSIMPNTKKVFLAYSQWLMKQKEVCEILLQKSFGEASLQQKSNMGAAQGMTFKMDDKSLYFVLEDSAGELNISGLKKGVEGNEGAILNLLKYDFPFFEDEAFLQLMAYSERDLAVVFSDKTTGETVRFSCSNSEMKDLLAHFHSLSLAQKGLKLFKEGKHSDALSHLLQAAEEGDLMAQYRLAGMYYAGQGTAVNKEEFMKWITPVTEQDEDKWLKADALNDMAYYYADQKQYDIALSVIDKAIGTLPKTANYYDSKGEFLYLKGDKKGAKEMWNKVISLDPDFLKSHDSNLYKLLHKK